MIVVSDTSPLNYLVQIEAIELLRQLYGEVYVPPAVIGELRHAGAPIPVREWSSSPPPWVVVRAPARVDPGLASDARLDAGEVEAIALARELGAMVLVDERAAARVADAMGLLSTGTLGVLDGAAKRGLIALRPLLDRLVHQTSFRCSQVLIDRLLERDAQRHRRD